MRHATPDSVRYHRFPIKGIESMTAVTARSYPRHTHDQYGIGIVDFGARASWSGRGRVEAGPGHFICVNPGEVHDGTAIGRRPRPWCILYFDPALMDEVRRDITGERETPFTFASPVFDDGALRPLFNRAYSFAGASRDCIESAMACEHAILHLVAHLGVHSTRPAKPSCATPRISRVRERIEADPSASVTVAEIANEIGRSRYQPAANPPLRWLVRLLQRSLASRPAMRNSAPTVLTPSSEVLRSAMRRVSRWIR